MLAPKLGLSEKKSIQGKKATGVRGPDCVRGKEPLADLATRKKGDEKETSCQKERRREGHRDTKAKRSTNTRQLTTLHTGPQEKVS